MFFIWPTEYSHKVKFNHSEKPMSRDSQISVVCQGIHINFWKLSTMNNNHYSYQACRKYLTQDLFYLLLLILIVFQSFYNTDITLNTEETNTCVWFVGPGCRPALSIGLQSILSTNKYTYCIHAHKVYMYQTYTVKIVSRLTNPSLRRNLTLPHILNNNVTMIKHNKWLN